MLHVLPIFFTDFRLQSKVTQTISKGTLIVSATIIEGYIDQELQGLLTIRGFNYMCNLALESMSTGGHVLIVPEQFRINRCYWELNYHGQLL